ncbi:CRP-like cAMP-binding protein [Paenibacillus phyllosphaerae]|uniref:CRP-like cAMP-binding protein n=1 Tax=Paenibacillus phyllosphaerae TaxID=274593 RepID=A0A7W5B170_9BACL|nr:cyclic nucleotide-binding domain-containing protein [Paenibacillus phyllosphaerae]MBB3111816.1 CRP-like cAMP-binding protein [Paenibacillus phyllosphaerae]
MKEIADAMLLQQYLAMPQLETVLPEALLPHLSLYGYEPGEFVCSQGETPQQLYVLVKGKLKIYTNTAEGRAIILSFKTPIEVIGDIEYIRGTDIHNTVEAVTPVHMIVIPYKWLRKYGKDHAPLLQFLLEIITRKFTIKSNAFSFNLLYPVEVRLASYMLSVCFDESDTRFHGKLRTDQLKDAANLIGTSYRHMNRIIQQFCAEGLLERRKGVIVVKDKEGLRKRASENIYE